MIICTTGSVIAITAAIIITWPLQNDTGKPIYSGIFRANMYDV